MSKLGACMDWRLIGFTASGTWFLLLVVDDLAALLKFPRGAAASARNVAFVVALGALVVFGYVLLQSPHGRCALGAAAAA